ncbi:hypothetical protein SNE40_000405 [Patella caerulea]|uniref:Uncharacterized protein n=1 Tax=Patella caerulea TaxID=87958 RepID=A0AAN8KJN8_PATCE
MDKKQQFDPVVEQPYTPESLTVNNSVKDEEKGVESYSMDPYIKNTSENKNLEANTILPYLVRRRNSEELLPRPWKSVNQLIIVSYVSAVLCCFLGVVANHFAWRAKKTKNENRYHETKKFGKRSVIFIYLAFAGFLTMCIYIPIIILNEYGYL